MKLNFADWQIEFIEDIQALRTGELADLVAARVKGLEEPQVNKNDWWKVHQAAVILQERIRLGRKIRGYDEDEE